MLKKKKIQNERSGGRSMTLVRSTVFRLIAIIVLMVLPINIITLILVQVTMSNSQKTMRMQAENALEISISNFTEELKNANRELQYLSLNDTNVSILEGSMSGYSYIEERTIVNEVIDELTSIVYNYSLVDMAYFSIADNGYDLLGGSLGVSRDKCLDAVHMVSNETTKRYGTTWKVAKIDGKMVLIGFNRWRGAEFGMLVNLDKALNQMALPTYEKNYITCFADTEEQIVSKSAEAYFEENQVALADVEKQKKSYVFKVAQETYGVELIQIVEQRAVSASVSMATGTLEIFAVLLTVLALPVLLIFTSRWVVSPLNRLTGAISKIEQGDLEYRIPEGNQGLEFEQINHSFNQMMEQVQELKIDVYEHELEKKNITMRYLSQQIQPHFILNAMNILYSYEPEEYELSQKMILCISKYFRYIVNANARFVALNQEMAHIRNYFEIQKARFPGLFFSIVEYEEDLAQALIPPLLIQNFVENAIKHSLKIGNKITIFVVGESIQAQDGTNMMRIRMADTGEGISTELLEEIEAFKRTGTHQPHLGVGIENSIERLKYLYEDCSSIDFSRDAHYHGTNIEIRLPIYFEEERHEDLTDR